MNKLGPGAQPFQTSNAALAFALYSAGVPFADDRNPCYNLYDAEMLGKLGFRGLTLEDATKAAFESGKKGHVEYLFKRIPQLSKLLKAFASQEKEFNESDVIGTELVAKIIKGVADKTVSEPEGLLRLACVNLKMRTAFMNEWRNHTPLVKIDNPGKVETRDTARGTVASHPGYKIVSLNASAKTRKHLNL